MLPVIHVAFEDQAVRNAGIAFGAGANGAFLINHSMGSEELLAIHACVASAFPGSWLMRHLPGSGPGAVSAPDIPRGRRHLERQRHDPRDGR